MSEAIVKGDSDDEFHDAVSESGAEKSNEEIVEEIIREQGGLTLDDVAADAEDKEGEITGTSDLKTNENDGEGQDMVEEISNLEEELKELEKGLSAEEILQRKEEADKLKMEGNEFFKIGEAEKSIAVYTSALRICPTTYSKERAILYGNRAAAKIKIDSKKSAIDDCTNAITLWPEYVRAILRRARLYHDTDKLDESLDDYKRVYELDPGNCEAREAMMKLPPLIEARNEKMKQEMLSKLKDLGNMVLKPFGLSTSNFQMQQDPSTGSYSINFNQNKN